VNDLPRSHFGDEVPQAFIREHHRVGDDLRLQISGGIFQVCAFGIRANLASDIGTSEIGREISRAMGAADFQPREAVQRAVENQFGEKQRRFKWIADDVAEIAASLERVLLHYVIGVGGMEEYRHIQLFGLAPEWIVFLAGGDFAYDGADRCTAKPEMLYRALELFRR